MVYFRSKNFGIEDSSRERFESVHEQEHAASSLCSGADGVVVGSGNSGVLVRGKDGKRKRVVKFDRDVSAVRVCGELSAWGDERGEIKVVGKMRSTIRQYHEHEARVNEIRIDGTMMVSCSDDMKIKIFDLSKAESVATISDSTDYVKSVDVECGVVFSGSYDGIVRGHSMRTFEKVFEYDSRRRVSRVCCLGGDRVAFASGSEVCVIDVSGPGTEVGRFGHIKEVTSMVFYGGRLYTGSLDANVRVFTPELRIISRVGVRGGITSLSIGGDVLYLGLEDGGVLRLARSEPEEKKKMEFRNREDGLRDEVEVRVVQNPLQRLTRVERGLNRFEYKKSMMGAMGRRDVQEMFGVMSYIHEKQGFGHALLDLDRRELGSVLDVITEFFGIKEFVPIFSDCVGVILSMYERDIRDDEELVEKLEALGDAVDGEVHFQEQNLRSIAFLECFGE